MKVAVEGMSDEQLIELVASGLVKGGHQILTSRDTRSAAALSQDAPESWTVIYRPLSGVMESVDIQSEGDQLWLIAPARE